MVKELTARHVFLIKRVIDALTKNGAARNVLIKEESWNRAEFLFVHEKDVLLSDLYSGVLSKKEEVASTTWGQLLKKAKRGLTMIEREIEDMTRQRIELELLAGALKQFLVEDCPPCDSTCTRCAMCQGVVRVLPIQPIQQTARIEIHAKMQRRLAGVTSFDITSRRSRFNTG